MPEQTVQEQERRFCEMMQRIDRLYEAFARARGMTYMSMTVLECICAHPDDCTQKLICEQTHYPKQSVNLIVKSFREAGYAALEELPADRRNKRIVLTQAGQAYAGRTVGALWRIDRDAAMEMPAAQREQLLQLLGAYTDAYERGVQAALDAPDGI